MNQPSRATLLAAFLWSYQAIAAPGDSGSDDPAPPTPPEAPTSAIRRFTDDVQAYYTAPLHWDLQEWGYFGGAIALTARSASLRHGRANALHPRSRQ